MTLEQCYEALGGNYAEVSKRLPSPRLVSKFVGKFLEDTSYQDLCAQLQAGNCPAAFRAAHTLKGVCANLSFTCLQTSANALTEVLRKGTDTVPAGADALLEDVRRDYQQTVEAIQKYQADL